MPGSKYPDEVRAQVVAGARAGLPSPRIAAETNVPVRTVREWIAHAKEQAKLENRDPLLVNREYRLAFMAQAINERQLEEIAELADNDKPTVNYILPVNALRGTAIDKVLKNRESSQPQSLTQVLVILNCESPEDVLNKAKEYIEGEVKDA